MHTTTRWMMVGLTGLLLAACGSGPVRDSGSSASASASRGQPAEPGQTHGFGATSTVNDYKTLAAQHIVAANAGQMFSGQIPPILRSVVVLNLSIDKNGNLTRAVVQRSRNEQASALALNAVRRVGTSFPKPLHLIRDGYRTLDYSETFLFNDDLQFQIRTLAGVQ